MDQLIEINSLEEYEKAKEMFYIVDDEALNSKFDRF